MKWNQFGCFGFCLFLLRVPVSTGQSRVICSSQPIVALVGDTVVLSCRLDPPISASYKTVEWTKPGLDPEYIHLRQERRLVFHSQNPSYNHRTMLFLDLLIHGNVSLKIFNVKLSDEGKYRCFIPSLWKEAFVQLNVAGSASSPVIKMSKSQSGMMLECKSAGWYPEPEVLWLDAEGHLVSAGPTETLRGPDGLYTVSSSVTVEHKHNNTFTCKLQQNKTNQTRETQIQVPDDFFMASCSSAACWSILGLFFVFVLAAGFVLWRWKQKKTKAKKQRDDEENREKLIEDEKADRQRREEEVAGAAGNMEKQMKELENLRDKLRMEEKEMKKQAEDMGKKLKSVLETEKDEKQRNIKLEEIITESKNKLTKRREEHQLVEQNMTHIMNTTQGVIQTLTGSKKDTQRVHTSTKAE